MPAAGGEATFLTACGTGGIPSYSPDGGEILFVRDEDIWKIPAAGGEPVQLTRTHERELSPGFSPDGTRIMFMRTSAHAGDIWIADMSRLGALQQESSP